MKNNSKYSHLSKNSISVMNKITIMLLLCAAIASYVVYRRATSYNDSSWVNMLNIMIVFSLSIIKTPRRIKIGAITWNLFIITIEGIIMIIMTEMVIIFDMASHTQLMFYTPLFVFPIIHCNLIPIFGVVPTEDDDIINAVVKIKEYPIVLSSSTIFILVSFEIYTITNNIILTVIFSLIIIVVYVTFINRYYLNCIKKAGWCVMNRSE